jgi:hypothetical protein
MTARYELDADNAVKVFYPDSDVASLYQPNWPNGDAWADAAEAVAWAVLYLASINDEDAPYAPGARGEIGRAKPTAEQKAAIAAARAAIEAATTPEERQTAQAALRAIYEAMN